MFNPDTSSTGIDRPRQADVHADAPGSAAGTVSDIRGRTAPSGPRHLIPFAEVSGLLETLDGRRVRVTWPNDCRKSGLISMRPLGPRLHLFHDGHLVGGEYDGAIEVERMGENGRYQVVRKSGSRSIPPAPTDPQGGEFAPRSA